MPAPRDMVAAFGALWVQDRADASVWRLSGRGQVLARIPNTAPSGDGSRFRLVSAAIRAGFGSVWSLTDDALVRIDPSSDRVVATVPIAYPFALGIGEGAVWVVCCKASVTLLRIDPSTMRSQEFASLGTTASALGVGAGSVWWGRASEGGGMYRIDPRTGDAADLQVGYNDRFIVPVGRWVWLVNDGSVERFDPRTGARVGRPRKIAQGSIGVGVSGGTIWINDGEAVALDTATGEVTHRLPGFTDVRWWTTGGIARLGSRVWVVDPRGDRVLGLPIG